MAVEKELKEIKSKILDYFRYQEYVNKKTFDVLQLISQSSASIPTQINSFFKQFHDYIYERKMLEFKKEKLEKQRFKFLSNILQGTKKSLLDITETGLQVFFPPYFVAKTLLGVGLSDFIEQIEEQKKQREELLEIQKHLEILDELYPFYINYQKLFQKMLSEQSTQTKIMKTYFKPTVIEKSPVAEELQNIEEVLYTTQMNISQTLKNIKEEDKKKDKFRLGGLLRFLPLLIVAGAYIWKRWGLKGLIISGFSLLFGKILIGKVAGLLGTFFKELLLKKGWLQLKTLLPNVFSKITSLTKTTLLPSLGNLSSKILGVTQSLGKFLPVAGGLVSVGFALKDAFSLVTEKTKELVGVGGWAKAVGGFLGGKKGGVGGAVGGVMKGAGIGAMIGSIFGPVGTAIGAGVGGLIGGILGFIGGPRIAKTFQNVWNRIKNATSSFVSFVSRNGRKLLQWGIKGALIGGPLGAIIGIASGSLIPKLKSTFGFIYSKGKEIITYISKTKTFEYFKMFFDKVYNFVKNIIDKFILFFRNLDIGKILNLGIKNIKKFLSFIPESIKFFLDNFRNIFLNAFKTGLSFIKKFDISDILISFTKDVKIWSSIFSKSIKMFLDNFKNIFLNIFKTVVSFIKNFNIIDIIKKVFFDKRIYNNIFSFTKSSLISFNKIITENISNLQNNLSNSIEAINKTISNINKISFTLTAFPTKIAVKKPEIAYTEIPSALIDLEKQSLNEISIMTSLLQQISENTALLNDLINIIKKQIREEKSTKLFGFIPIR